jgi:hypothetical protein
MSEELEKLVNEMVNELLPMGLTYDPVTRRYTFLMGDLYFDYEGSMSSASVIEDMEDNYKMLCDVIRDRFTAIVEEFYKSNKYNLLN